MGRGTRCAWSALGSPGGSWKRMGWPACRGPRCWSRNPPMWPPSLPYTARHPWSWCGGRARDVPPHAARYGLGPGDNPVFPGLWEAAQLVAGGSLLGARLIADGEAERVFHFAGGLHHAMPDRASGFCYVNDAVLAILELRRRGLRVAYVDIDAHHGDGVQFAFYADPDVLTVSTHWRGGRRFPGTGFVSEMGSGAGVGFSVKLPLQPFTDDDVYHPAFEAVVPPIVGAFRPDVIVAQLGIDAHRTDPLTH